GAHAQLPGHVDLDAQWSPSAEPPHYRSDFTGNLCLRLKKRHCPLVHCPTEVTTHAEEEALRISAAVQDYPTIIKTSIQKTLLAANAAILLECGACLVTRRAHTMFRWREPPWKSRCGHCCCTSIHSLLLLPTIDYPIQSGFFSVVVSLFLTKSSEKLDVDYGQMTSLLVFEIAQLQRAALTGASESSIPLSPVNPD
ncbi:hypothetical protein CPB85DRAFT_1278495, partial [Mucidula mucida]